MADKGRGRPRNNNSRTLQGVRAKRKEEAEIAAPEDPADSPKAAIEKARSDLERHILATADKDLSDAFQMFGDGCDARTLMQIAGMELYRVQRKMSDGELAARQGMISINKLLEQLRRLVLMRDGSEAFIPDAIAIRLEVAAADDDPDYSDEPEFGE